MSIWISKQGFVVDRTEFIALVTGIVTVCKIKFCNPWSLLNSILLVS